MSSNTKKSKLSIARAKSRKHPTFLAKRARPLSHGLLPRLFQAIGAVFTRKHRHLSALIRRRNYKKELLLLLGGTLLLLVAVVTKPSPSSIADTADIAAISDSSLRSTAAKDIRKKLKDTQAQLAVLQDAQTKAGVSAVPDSAIAPLVVAVNQDLQIGTVIKARHDLAILARQVPVWQKQVADATQAKQEQLAAAQLAAQNAPKPPPLPTEPYWQVPILLYHQTPADFDNQLRTIQSRGYQAIDLTQLRAAILSNGPLPKKSVVITYDDGYAGQMSAFNLLEKYGMKATFYIIDGGSASNWCIGAGRLYQLPSQPVTGCGDQYLSWEQIRALDQSGLITIGSHTVDHLSLAGLSADIQRFEIVQGKVQLEAQLGHSVTDFAYPYGSFNSTSISIVQSAGFLTATSTIPGTIQTRSTLYSLRRIRSAYDLP